MSLTLRLKKTILKKLLKCIYFNSGLVDVIFASYKRFMGKGGGTMSCHLKKKQLSEWESFLPKCEGKREEHLYDCSFIFSSSIPSGCVQKYQALISMYLILFWLGYPDNNTAVRCE